MGGVPLSFNGMRSGSIEGGLQDLVKDKKHKELALATLAYIRYLRGRAQAERNWGGFGTRW